MYFNIFSSTVTELIVTFITFSVITWYFYSLYCFNYWKKKGVPTIKPQFPAGNITKAILGRENIFIIVQNFYNELKSKGHRHGGLYFFNGPVYIPIDPVIVKSILSTDFEYFVERGVFIDEKNFPLSGTLFSYGGLRWKNMRTKLSPSFSSGKLKTMYDIFLKMTQNFVTTVEKIVEEKNEVNIREVSANFTADIIFNTAFGLESDTLTNPDNELSRARISLFNPPSWLFIKTILADGLQNPGNLLRTAFENKPPIDFLESILKNTVRERDEMKNVRKDFLNLLLEIRDKDAGSDTSSQTISFCIHELSHNQKLQDNLRKEIHENLGNDYKKYTYEDIFKLPYLDKVFNETLRLHPVLGFFNRICVKPYKVPGTDVTIEKGTPVVIPVLGLQHDPEYFPDPLEFDPERFGEGKTQVPFTFLPFGDGPRICIGMRHGKLQTKLGIAALISQFKFFPDPSTPKQIRPDKISKGLSSFPEKGLTVKAVKIKRGLHQG